MVAAPAHGSRSEPRSRLPLLRSLVQGVGRQLDELQLRSSYGPHGASHAVGGFLIERNRVDAADTQGASSGGTLPEVTEGDHRAVRSGSARVERSSDAVS